LAWRAVDGGRHELGSFQHSRATHWPRVICLADRPRVPRHEERSRLSQFVE